MEKIDELQAIIDNGDLELLDDTLETLIRETEPEDVKEIIASLDTENSATEIVELVDSTIADIGEFSDMLDAQSTLQNLVDKASAPELDVRSDKFAQTVGEMVTFIKSLYAENTGNVDFVESVAQSVELPDTLKGNEYVVIADIVETASNADQFAAFLNSTEGNSGAMLSA